MFVGLVFSLCAYNISLYHSLFNIKFKLKIIHSGKCYLVIINYHHLLDEEGGLHTWTKAVVHACACACVSIYVY